MPDKINLDSSGLKSVKRSSEHACLSLAKSSPLSSPTLQLVVTSVANKFSKGSMSDKTVNNDAGVVDDEDEDKMIAVKDVVTVKLVVKSILVLISEADLSQ